MAHNTRRGNNLILAITIIAAALLLFSIAAYTTHPKIAQAQPEPTPEPTPPPYRSYSGPITIYGTAIAILEQSYKDECYVTVHVQREYFGPPGSLYRFGLAGKDVSVETKERDLCTLLETAYITRDTVRIKMFEIRSVRPTYFEAYDVCLTYVMRDGCV